MSGRLRGKRVAILIEALFDASGVTGPRELLRAQGAEVIIVGPFAAKPYIDRTGAITIVSDVAAGDARMIDFDALIIPGGYAPDKMRMRHAMMDLVTEAIAAMMPVATIDRGAQVLISANAIRGRVVTCWPSIAIDVKNAGGSYVDRPVVRDGNVITSRKDDDVPAFTEAVIQAILER
jgi:protease I